MNSKPFIYYRPGSQAEIVALLDELSQKGLTYAFYAGGTELITQFRRGQGIVDAVIDLKGIESLKKIEFFEEKMVIGSAVPLNHVIDRTSIGSIKRALEGIADHTVRNTLTIGGNICGRLPYREAILPLLCREAQVTVLEEGLLNVYKLESLFDKRLKLKANALLWSIEVDTNPMALEISQRHTATTDVDYPIIHHYAVLDKDRLTIALSGFSNFPIYEQFDFLTLIEAEDKMNLLMAPFENQVKSDDRGSAEYRLALLNVCTKNIIEAVMANGGLK